MIESERFALERYRRLTEVRQDRKRARVLKGGAKDRKLKTAFDKLEYLLYKTERVLEGESVDNL